MKFQYQAKNRQGMEVEGVIDGASAMSARSSLRFAGMEVSRISPVTGSKSNAGVTFMRSPLAKSNLSKPNRWPGFSVFGKRVSRRDLVVALSQLSIMLQSGDDLAGAIGVVATQCNSSALREVMHAIHRDVEEGVGLSEAMAKHPKVFDLSMVAVIDAGQHSGKLIEVLERLTSLLQKDQQLKSNVLSMLTYPAILMLITASVISSMFFFVLPQFATVFRDMDRPVPPLTAFLLNIGITLRSYWMVLLGGIGALIATVIYARRLPQWRYAVDYLILNTVGLRQATRPLLAGRIFRLMGTMIANGVPLLETIQLTQKATSNIYFRNLFQQIEHDILEGKGIGPAVAAVSFLPSGAGHMLETGERTARLAFVLQTIGEYFESEGEQKLRWFVKLLEPSMIMTLGGVVGTVVMSIVLPMLDITTAS